MIVTKLVLQNWRNFRAVNIELAQRVFVAGPNASGKSNLLDVFAFLRDIAKKGGGLQNAVNERGGISKLRCLAARRYPDVEIEVQASDNGTLWSYAIGIRQEARGYRQPLLSYEKVMKGDQTILKRPDDEDKRDPLRLTQTTSSKSMPMPSLGTLCASLNRQVICTSYLNCFAIPRRSLGRAFPATLLVRAFSKKWRGPRRAREKRGLRGLKRPFALLCRN